jgi:hypothetical protein
MKHEFYRIALTAGLGFAIAGTQISAQQLGPACRWVRVA